MHSPAKLWQHFAMLDVDKWAFTLLHVRPYPVPSRADCRPSAANSPLPDAAHERLVSPDHFEAYRMIHGVHSGAFRSFA